MPSSVSLPVPPVVAHLAAVAEEYRVSGRALLTALSGVPDPRARRGVRHQMSTIFGVALCAVLAGARSFTAIGEWAANASRQVLAALGAGGCPPSESCVRRTLQNLEADTLDALLGEWATGHTGEFGGRRAVAVDGKPVRGSRGAQGPARYLMAAIDHHAAVVIGQVDVSGNTNEISMFAQLCDQIPRSGAGGGNRGRGALPKRPHRLSGASPRRALHPDRQRQPACATTPAHSSALKRRPPRAHQHQPRS